MILQDVNCRIINGQREGYSDEEIAMFEKLLYSNAHFRLGE